MNAACPACETPLEPHRADDAPPYFTIFIVGHIVVPLVLMTERAWAPATWIHALIWTPVILGLTVMTLPRVKGAVIGLQWALGVKRDD